jgi:hypothetical protein
MKIDGEDVQGWLDLTVTKKFLERLSVLEIERLRAIVVSDNKDEAAGIVKGITLVKSLIESAKEKGL